MGNEVLKKYRRSKKGVLTNIYDHLKRRNKAKFGMELTFTSKEFQEKYIDDNDFLNIYNGWVDSGYQYYKKPSVDRKNPDEPYIFENMQFMTWEENRKKGEKERSRIVTSISMFDLDGKHIKDFDSVKQNEEAVEMINNVLSSDYHFDETLGYQLTSDDFVWLEKSKEALEKQIPKFVLCPKGFRGMRDTRFHCPDCKSLTRQREEFCHVCGQHVKYPKEVYDKENNKWIFYWN